MAQYTVKDNQTGKTITFNWNGEDAPTDTDMEEVFAAARGGAGDTGRTLPNSLAKNPMQPTADELRATEAAKREWIRTGGDTSKGSVGGVPKWGRDNPTLYGVYGAVKESLPAGLGMLGAYAGPVGAGIGAGGGEIIKDTLTQYAEGQDVSPEASVRSFAKSGLIGAGGEVLGAGVGKAVTGTINTAKKIKAAGGARQAAKDWLDTRIKQSAGRALESATTKEGIVAEQAAKNIAETEELAGRIGGGYQVGLGQMSEDPATLALQRQLNMKNQTAQIMNAEQQMINNQALSDMVNRALPEGGTIDDVIAALEREKAAMGGTAATARNAADAAADATLGATKEEAGATLRTSAKSARDVARSQAKTLYDNVPRDMEIDSTPLYDTLNRIKADYDPAFQAPKITPIGTVNRAKSALEPEPSQLLGADGLPYNQPRIDADMPERMTFGQLQDFKSQVTTAMREASASGNYNLARKYGELADGVESTLAKAADEGAGEGVEALKAANRYYREDYVPRFRQGGTSKVLATDKTGGARVDTALVGNQYFKPGQQGVEAAESFNRTFAGDDAAKQALKDHVAQDLLTAARNPTTGELSSSNVQRWLYRHNEALKRLGFDGEFNGVQSALKLADDARGAEAAFNKSRFAKAIDQVDTDKAMKYLFEGNNSKDTARTMKELLRITEGDQAARNGLKTEFANMIRQRAESAAKDMAGGKIPSQFKLGKVNAQFEPAMKMLYSKPELQALQDVQRAYEIGARINKAPTGMAGSHTAEFGSDSLKTFMPLDYKFRVMRFVFNRVKGEYDEKLSQYLGRAMYDPSFAKELKVLATMAHKKTPDYAAKRLMRNIDAAITGGLISATSNRRGNNGEAL